VNRQLIWEKNEIQALSQAMVLIQTAGFETDSGAFPHIRTASRKSGDPALAPSLNFHS
jgi:hypothetical protein